MPVAKIGDETFTTIEAAIAAAEVNDTIELLDNVAMDNALLVEGKTLTVDLKGFTITPSENFAATYIVSIENAANVTFTNGTINLLGKNLQVKTGATVTVAANTTVTGTATYMTRAWDGTYNIYGTINHSAGSGAAVQAIGAGAVVNVYDGASIVTTGAEANPIRCSAYGDAGDQAVNIFGGTLEVRGSANCIYAYGAGNRAVITVYDGTFIAGYHTDHGDYNGIFRIMDDSSVTPLTDSCTAKFNTNKCGWLTYNDPLANYCADGYAPVKGDDGWYTIQKVYDITITDPIEGGTLETSVTNNIVAGTEVTITATPADGYKLGTLAVTNLATEAEVEVTENAFTMPEGNVKVYATFEQNAQPLDPEQPTQPFDTDDQAKAAAAAMNDGDHVKTSSINVPEQAGTEQADKDAYAALFVAVAKADKTVEIELNEAGTNALKAATAAIETAVANNLGAITAAEAGDELDFGTITENVKPGFWYGVAVTTELGSMKTTNPATWVQATKAGVTLKATKPEGNAAFFQTKAKATNK